MGKKIKCNRREKTIGKSDGKRTNRKKLEGKREREKRRKREKTMSLIRN